MAAEYDIDYGISCGVRNSDGQKFQIETRADDIFFIVSDGDKTAEFKISYNNKIVIENIRKQFNDCSAHASTIRSAIARKGFADESRTSTQGTDV